MVGDGQWIWTAPPEGSTGYLDPRPFSVKIGIQLQGRGDATRLAATTTLPVECPEQRLEDEQISTEGCQAQTRQIGPHARQLVLTAAGIAAGQTVSASWQAKVTAFKQCFHYRPEQFPEKQSVPAEVARQYTGDSPGIQTRLPSCASCETSCGATPGTPGRSPSVSPPGSSQHPPAVGPLHQRRDGPANAAGRLRGDVGPVCGPLPLGGHSGPAGVGAQSQLGRVLPARPGGRRSIGFPAHTACYFWFGWTGAHELVLQKGDRLRVPERGKDFRLQEDWMQWGGAAAVRLITGADSAQPSKTMWTRAPARKKRRTASGSWWVRIRRTLCALLKVRMHTLGRCKTINVAFRSAKHANSATFAERKATEDFPQQKLFRFFAVAKDGEDARTTR